MFVLRVSKGEVLQGNFFFKSTFWTAKVSRLCPQNCFLFRSIFKSWQTVIEPISWLTKRMIKTFFLKTIFLIGVRSQSETFKLRKFHFLQINLNIFNWRKTSKNLIFLIISIFLNSFENEKLVPKNWLQTSAIFRNFEYFYQFEVWHPTILIYFKNPYDFLFVCLFQIVRAQSLTSIYCEHDKVRQSRTLLTILIRNHKHGVC